MANHPLQNVGGFKKRRDYYMVDPFSIVRTDLLSRDTYGDQKDIDLKNDIAANGVKEPLKVQKNDDDNRLYLVNGSRRLWCCDRLKEEGITIESVPVLLVDKKLSQSELLFEALSSNNGKDLTPFEEAEAFRRQRAYGLDVKYIAERIGKSEGFVRGRLELINASPETRAAVSSGSVGITAASRAVASSGGDPEKQKSAIKKAATRRAAGRMKWDKQTKCIVANGFTSEQESVLAELMPTGFNDKLRSVGLDPESFKLSIAEMVI